MGDQILDSVPSFVQEGVLEKVTHKGNNNETNRLIGESLKPQDTIHVDKQDGLGLHNVREALVEATKPREASFTSNASLSDEEILALHEEQVKSNDFVNAAFALDRTESKIKQRISKFIHKKSYNTLVARYKNELPKIKDVSTLDAVVQNLLTYAPEETAGVGNLLLELSNSPDPIIRGLGIYALPGLLHVSDTQIRNAVANRIEDILKKTGIPIDELLQAWDATSSKEDKYKHAYSINLVRIIDLENLKPGENFCKTLYEEFGIKDFARYPTDLLVKQFEEKDKTDIPYGVLIYPRDDWNQSFYENYDMLSNFCDQLKDSYSLRVFESSSKRGLVHTLNASRKKYGKITFAMISGHGDKVGLQLANSKEGSIDIPDVEKEGAKALALAFEENPEIILNSCSVGKKDGFAKVLSLLGAKVIAAKRDGGVNDIKVSFDEQGKPHFDVAFVKKWHAQRYEKGTLRTS